MCRQLHEYASQTPILFYSGNAFQRDKEKAQAAGASDYLTKPYIGDLAATISLAVKMSKESIANIPDNSFLESQKIDEVQILQNVFERLTLTNRT